MKRILTAVGLFLLISLPTLHAGQAPEFPETWLNSKPYKLENLRGKTVFLYFFEET